MLLLLLHVIENNFIWRFMELWRAIPDVPGHPLSEAKPVIEEDCAPY